MGGERTLRTTWWSVDQRKHTKGKREIRVQKKGT